MVEEVVISAATITNAAEDHVEEVTQISLPGGQTQCSNVPMPQAT
jgi:hypothetical protein